MAANHTEDCKSDSVGIVSMECYFPKLYISQSEYETYNNVSSGKYTIGLGQKEMAFTSDREDICSICLTVLSNLISKNNISYSDIGWICVATETIIDHSKSISSSLQQLFINKGNSEIEGIDVKHACYGGTFALFTAFDRINSKYWDGKYCIIISADIAEYSNGPARCTGGVGAIGILLGKNPCIDLNIIRSTYKSNEYDFYKPYLNSSYPVVNGHVSNQCYLNAFDSCYNKYIKKINQNENENIINNYWIFHAPYNKLVTKTFGRVMYHDFLNNKQYYFNKYKNNKTIFEFLKKYENISYKNTVNTRQVIKTFEKLSKDYYNKYVLPSTFIPKSIGNCYTASIFMGLLSLIYESKNNINQLLNKNIQMFSYGSGTLASIYSLKIINSQTSKKLLNKIIKNNNITKRFNERIKINCNMYTNIMNNRETLIKNNYNIENKNKNDFVPTFEINKKYFYDNCYYLTKIDNNKQRFYKKFKYNKENIEKNKNKIYINNNDFKNDFKNNLELFGKSLSKSARSLIKEMTYEHRLSKQGAIKIDNMINKTEQTINTKCSNS